MQSKDGSILKNIQILFNAHMLCINNIILSGCRVLMWFCYSSSIQNDYSIVPRQALSNGTEYALSTKMTPANVARTYSEPKEKEKVKI